MVPVRGVKGPACCCLKGEFENHMLFVANSTTVASQANPVSPVYMASNDRTVTIGPIFTKLLLF